MTWQGVKTWATGETLLAADMLLYINDNLEALKDPPADEYDCDEGSDYTTASTSFADIDATNLGLTITTTGGDIMVGFVGSISNSAAGNHMFLELDIDGSPVGDDDGLLVITAPVANYRVNASFVVIITGQGAASHTIKLQWKTSAGTATLYAGAGTASGDIHPQFWVREI